MIYPTVLAIVAIVGGIALLVSIFNGVSGKYLNVPVLPPQTRVLSGVVGGVLLIGALWFAYPGNEPSPQPATRTPTQLVSTDTPAPTITVSPMPSATSTTAPPTDTPVAPSVDAEASCESVGGIELLESPWQLTGNNGDAQAYLQLKENALDGMNSLMVVYDLHGLDAIEGEAKDASALIFDQPNWHVISLANNGENGKDGMQTIVVPLSDFVGLPDVEAGISGGTQLDLSAPIGTLHIRIWSPGSFTVDVLSVCAFSSP